MWQSRIVLVAMPHQNPHSADQSSHPVSSNLVPHELSVESHPDTPEQCYRFRNHSMERSAWLRVLDRAEIKPSRRDRYRDCGSGAWLQYSESRRGYRVRSNTCRNRCCPACRVRYSRDLALRLSHAIGTVYQHEWRFVTFTIKHTKAPLRHQLDFLRQSFRKLRQRKCWKSHAFYGYATIEITYNAQRHEWHPHLHILTRSEFLPYPQIKAAWRAITNGSYIIDIQEVTSPDDVAEYITKYIAKPPPFDTFDSDDLLVEYYQAIAHGRLLIQFGKLRPWMPDKVEDGYPDDWQYTQPLSSVLALASTGDLDAQNILDRIGMIDEPYDEDNERAPPPCVGAEPLRRTFPFSRWT